MELKPNQRQPAHVLGDPHSLSVSIDRSTYTEISFREYEQQWQIY